MPDAYEPVDPDYAERRVQVPQGCTGLWQVGLHSYDLPSASPQYDDFYLDHASIRLDLWILWRTALLVLRLGPPVGLDDVPLWITGPLAARRTEPVVESASVTAEAS